MTEVTDRRIWDVRRVGTGCRVGVLRMALRAPFLVVEFFNHDLMPWDPKPSDVRPRALARREFPVDHKAGVVWVDRAADLHGFAGFELDA